MSFTHLGFLPWDIDWRGSGVKSCSHSLPKKYIYYWSPFHSLLDFGPWSRLQIQQELIQLQCVTMTLALAKSTILTLYRENSNLNTLCGHSQNCVSNTFHLWAIHNTNANMTTIIYHNYNNATSAFSIQQHGSCRMDQQSSSSSSPSSPPSMSFL